MRVSREDIYRELAKIAKEPESIRIYFNNHIAWHKQGRKMIHEQRSALQL